MPPPRAKSCTQANPEFFQKSAISLHAAQRHHRDQPLTRTRSDISSLCARWARALTSTPQSHARLSMSTARLAAQDPSEMIRSKLDGPPQREARQAFADGVPLASRVKRQAKRVSIIVERFSTRCAVSGGGVFSRCRCSVDGPGAYPGEWSALSRHHPKRA
jgi:hypothetical protein